MVYPIEHDNGPCIVTFPTRTRFYFRRPTPKMIHLSDIAHSLCLVTRFNGHIKRHYSVIEHSYQVALEVLRRTDSPEAALCGALHDSEEAYTCDLPGPIKQDIEQFRVIADRIKGAILVRFQLEECYPRWEPIVKEIDDRMLHTESIQLSHGATWEDWSKILPLEISPYREQQAIHLLEKSLELCDSNKKAHKKLVKDYMKLTLDHLKAGGDAMHARDYFLSSVKGWLISTDRTV